MGKGKGAPEFWVAVIKPGRIMFEVSGVSKDLAHEALGTCSYKLPIKTKVVSRPDLV
jgi:large subunit ribosomal protein L16